MSFGYKAISQTVTISCCHFNFDKIINNSFDSHAKWQTHAFFQDSSIVFCPISYAQKVQRKIKYLPEKPTLFRICCTQYFEKLLHILLILL